MLTQGRNTTELADGKTLVLPVKGGVKIFEGAFVAVDADGFAIPATKAPGLLAAGRAEQFADNTQGEDGDIRIVVRRGVFKWNNAASGPVTERDVLKPCYMNDDESVTITETDSSVAGKIIGIDGDQVIVETL
ncbi:hypothetical protein POTG_01749 [Paenibacillus sp. oral taxon 786 str. D14]|uniref:hypothetical protein n=1 Tax=Paenibacillus sp. oral taxon 786 TaxID=652715 RepID=UPI0001AFD288|nr:hypothetical protein [Paenibacillus sp. oral taxon 786]EES73454.1 hypothetical protein POTG_01749 [Paenibacillus sp. oral taxon 786 str. D14]